MAKILIVDDDPDILEVVGMVLEKEGHQIATAPSREEGMAAVNTFRPDLIVLDVMMDQPDDGFVMAQDLRKGGFAAPILMLTSVGKVTGMDFGADESVVPVDDFQEKPISPDALIEKVKALLVKKGGGA
ncbi:MAG TPA: response regulator transcription factor [bacterium]|nr:response regulator transcription factor [bacterium]